MLPPLKVVRRGLRRSTEALATELAQARPGNAMPTWNELEWRLATAAAAVHGVAPLLSRYSTWPDASWRAFVQSQRDHVEHRHQRIARLLHDIDAGARVAGVAAVPLKGAALHAIGLYVAGERPMADIDLLVHEDDVEPTVHLLQSLGYAQSFVQWKHRVFKPVTGEAQAGLGDHRDTPINIELHVRIQERLPVRAVDITERIYPAQPQPGLNDYPSTGALMSHLLLHAAGNMCGRSLRLLHLNDISLLATRMVASDWDVLWGEHGDQPPWWALPPLRLVARYYRHAIPAAVLARLEAVCPPLLRAISRRQTLTDVSGSDLWLHAVPGIEWSRSLGEVARYMHNRVRPTNEATQERADMVRTQLWLRDQSWVTMKQGRRMLIGLLRSVPRMDTLYAVRAALDASTSANWHPAQNAWQPSGRVG